MKRFLSVLFCFLSASLFGQVFSTYGHVNPTLLKEPQKRFTLRDDIEMRGFSFGTPVFIRVFKQENILEMWMQIEDGSYRHFRTYPICIYSGELGPKTKQGDKQAPEGFYQFNKTDMNPNSQFYRSFDLNYPNAYDRAHGYTGSLLMVHGKCHSVGCYAMGDKQMGEIYEIVEWAFRFGQREIEVHAFPFKMTPENLNRHQHHRWAHFWQTLKPAYDYFEQTKRPPHISVQYGQYQIQPSRSY